MGQEKYNESVYLVKNVLSRLYTHLERYYRAHTNTIIQFNFFQNGGMIWNYRRHWVWVICTVYNISYVLFDLDHLGKVYLSWPMKTDSTAHSVVKHRLGQLPLFWRPYMIYDYVKDKLSYNSCHLPEKFRGHCFTFTTLCRHKYVLLLSEMFGRNGNTWTFDCASTLLERIFCWLHSC